MNCHFCGEPVSKRIEGAAICKICDAVRQFMTDPINEARASEYIEEQCLLIQQKWPEWERIRRAGLADVEPYEIPTCDYIGQAERRGRRALSFAQRLLVGGAPMHDQRE